MGGPGMSMTLKQHVDHWVSSSEQSLLDMSIALKGKRRMNAIYSGHQSLEKILKALLAARNMRVVHIHKVAQLAEKCGYSLTQEQLLELETIDQFYIAAKYHSTKSRVYKQCTPQYTETWTKIMRKWHKHFKQQVITERTLLPNNTAASYPESIY